MTGTLLGMLITALQCLDSILFYDVFFRRRFMGMRFWLIFGGLTLVNGLFFNLCHVPAGFVKMNAALLGFLIINAVLYHGRWIFRGLIVCLFYAFLNAFDVASVYGVLFVLGGNLDTFKASRPLFVAVCICEQLLYMGILLLVKKVVKRKSELQAGGYYWLGPLLLTFGSAALNIYLLHAAMYSGADPDLVLVCTLFLVFVNLLVIVLIDWLEQNSRYREESLALNEKLHAQGESIEALGNAYAVQRRLTHDYTAHLVSLYGYLKEGAYDRAREYTRELLSQQNERLLAVNTHNAALDALFNQKAFVARKQDIDLRFVVSDLSGLAIRTSDLTVLISNLMDNAIEACALLPKDQREIEVRAILEETFLFSVRNRSLPVKIVDGTIPSTKPDPSMHGYGLANVRTILAQYSECYHDMTYKNGWFSYVVELPNLPRS